MDKIALSALCEGMHWWTPFSGAFPLLRAINAESAPCHDVIMNTLKCAKISRDLVCHFHKCRLINKSVSEIIYNKAASFQSEARGTQVAVWIFIKWSLHGDVFCVWVNKTSEQPKWEKSTVSKVMKKKRLDWTTFVLKKCRYTFFRTY